MLWLIFQVGFIFGETAQLVSIGVSISCGVCLVMFSLYQAASRTFANREVYLWFLEWPEGSPNSRTWLTPNYLCFLACGKAKDVLLLSVLCCVLSHQKMQNDSLVLHNGWIMAGQWVAVPVAGMGWLRKAMGYLSDLQVKEGARKGHELKEAGEKLRADG